MLILNAIAPQRGRVSGLCRCSQKAPMPSGASMDLHKPHGLYSWAFPFTVVNICMLDVPDSRGCIRGQKSHRAPICSAANFACLAQHCFCAGSELQPGEAASEGVKPTEANMQRRGLARSRRSPSSRHSLERGQLLLRAVDEVEVSCSRMYAMS